jgi:hypothetical protein
MHLSPLVQLHTHSYIHNTYEHTHYSFKERIVRLAEEAGSDRLESNDEIELNLDAGMPQWESPPISYNAPPRVMATIIEKARYIYIYI